jgi:hypothetical protein
VLDAVRAPLVLCDVCKHGCTTVEELVDDAILGLGLKVLEGMLKRIINRLTSMSK